VSDPVADSSDDLVTKGGLRLPPRAISWRFSRSSGPGGQHVNTADTRVELIADLTLLGGPASAVSRVRGSLGDDVRIVAANARSQLANRREATRRLATRLDRAAHTDRPRRPSRPSRGAVVARLSDKRRQASRKADRRTPRED
jgi:ribosome-associated protein